MTSSEESSSESYSNSNSSEHTDQDQEKTREFIKDVLSKKLYSTLTDAKVDLKLYNITLMPKELCDALASEIDKGTINYLIKKRIRKFDKDEYKNRIRQLKWNLTQNKAVHGTKYVNTPNDIPLLLHKVLSKETTIPFICEEATYRDLYPERFIQVDFELEEEFKHKYGIIDPETLPDGALQCRRCKSWKTSYYELQVKSGDENMTVFASCHSCKNKWRIG